MTLLNLSKQDMQAGGSPDKQARSRDQYLNKFTGREGTVMSLFLATASRFPRRSEHGRSGKAEV